MAFKSNAQRQKFLEKLSRGEITQEDFDGWEKGTDLARLPARVGTTPKAPAHKPFSKVKTVRVK